MSDHDTQTVEIDSLRLHPSAAQVPMPDKGDLRALQNSLRENGQQDPIDITSDGVILDGRTRWTLLHQEGATTIHARVVDIPPDQQVHWIVERALARRHLTLAQKRALNDVLQTLVVEERPNKSTGEPMRIGYSQTDRAAKLGVSRETVRRWDEDGPLVATNVATSIPPDAPTHAIDARGRPNLVHKPTQSGAPKPVRIPRPTPLRKARGIPAWSRQFSAWCRGTRPEDHVFLARVDREIHAALRRNGLNCEKEDIA